MEPLTDNKAGKNRLMLYVAITIVLTGFIIGLVLRGQKQSQERQEAVPAGQIAVDSTADE